MLTFSDTIFIFYFFSPSTSLFQMIALSRSLSFCFIFAFSPSLPLSALESAVIGYCFGYGPFWLILGWWIISRKFVDGEAFIWAPFFCT